eukprot:CAMPEP_0206027650 /NCGR_PEP_ID=MMETSP1464-20131121/43598_1 /ASSEMBLY_ACC=CAM_ASM_001124 /TAXON_ID=119497 /ORGANISM="Exanthemachrysis gayraliae, Strain RCC1523" /LENGTH=124 /DNA_ID=CAMNT_0053401695 /DNA_START=487 /DNA_END=857 /DNA_ORIENTATION=+
MPVIWSPGHGPGPPGGASAHRLSPAAARRRVHECSRGRPWLRRAAYSRMMGGGPGRPGRLKRAGPQHGHARRGRAEGPAARCRRARGQGLAGGAQSKGWVLLSPPREETTEAVDASETMEGARA